jgi:long-chain fatty acid transport protein
MEMTFRPALRPLLALAVLLVPAAARAQAFGVNEIGSCAIARSFAVVGAPCQDASTIFWNPAYASRLSGLTVSAGVALIDLSGDFTRDTIGTVYETEVPLLPVPSLFVNYMRPNSRRSVGLGVYVPYGLTMQWSSDFPGRFQAERAEVATIYVQPNFGFQISDNWSVGGGPIFGHSTVELKRSVDLADQRASAAATFAQLGIARGTEFARIDLEGSGMGIGGQIGVHGRLSPQWALGARFMLPIYFEYDGEAEFTQVSTGLVLGGTVQPPFSAGTPVDALVAPQFAAGAPLSAQRVRTKIVHPAQIQAGVGYTGFPNLSLALDYAWTGWKNLNQIVIDFQGGAPDAILVQDYNHSSAIRLSAEYALQQIQGAKLRAGFAGAATAAPDETVTPLLPEQDRNYITFGVGLPIGSTWGVDASYARVNTPGRRGRIIERNPDRSQTATQLNTGVYNLGANIFSVGIKGSF